MPWVLDDDVALRERERRLDDAYHTRRWPYTDGRRRFADGDDDAYGTATDDDDDALLHRGYGLPRQSGDVVVEDHVHHARPRRGVVRRGPAAVRGAAAATSAASTRPAATDRMAATHAPRHERHVTVVDHEHPVYVTREVVHRHRRVRYEHDAERHAEPHAADFFVDGDPLPTYDFTPRCRAPAYGHRAPPTYARGACGYDVGRAPSYAARASYADWAGSGFAAGVPAYASDLRF
ncbi:hypothetical protein JL720_13246 [Aureococcus anophagefferens]|nr:hypothetical protein JL720_13246 [Aureococcus anophagefferens]